VFEFRHQSWLENKVFHILKQHDAGFCVFDIPSISCPVIATTDFAYVRFHDSNGLYRSCYSDEKLAKWAKRLTDLGRNLKAVYIYFNNDAEAFAGRNATTLRHYLEQSQP